MDVLLLHLPFNPFVYQFAALIFFAKKLILCKVKAASNDK